MNYLYNKKSRSFTLIELLVVIAIIGILAAIVIVSVNSARQKAKDAVVMEELHQVRNAVAMYTDSNSISNLDCSPGVKPCEDFIGNSNNDLNQIGLLAQKVKEQVGNTDADGMTIVTNGEDYSISATLPTTIASGNPQQISYGSLGNSTSSPILANKFVRANQEYLKTTLPIFDLNTSWEIGGWFYPTDSSTGSLLGNRAGSIGTGIQVLRLPDGEIALSYDGSKQNKSMPGSVFFQFNTASIASVNSWSFVTAGYDASVKKLFISVNESRTYDPSYTIDNQNISLPIYNVRPFLFGGYWKTETAIDPGYSYDGKIDSLFYRKGSLYDDSQLTLLYNSGKGLLLEDLASPLRTNLVSWWNLNESAGKRYDAIGQNHLAPAGNVIIGGSLRNGNFETKDAAGTWFLNWYNAYSTGRGYLSNVGRSGLYSAKLSRIDAWTGARQNNLIIPGKTYKYSFWAKNDVGTTSSKLTSNTANSYYLPDGLNQSKNTFTVDSTWRFFTNTYTAAGANNIFGIYNYANNSSILVDDVRLEETGNPSVTTGVGFN